jgi:hypothetical protein
MGRKERFLWESGDFVIVENGKALNQPFKCQFCGITKEDGRRCPKAVDVRHPLPRPANPPRPTIGGS